MRKTFKPKRVSKMARQYNTQQDGFDNIPGRSVYHVVQQVAHAKPVAQHQPIFYGIICNSKVSFMKEINCLILKIAMFELILETLTF